MNKKHEAYCHFCGSKVGDISDRTGERSTAIFDCPKCKVNYCDQCSYFKEENKNVQLCLRCDSKMDKLV